MCLSSGWETQVSDLEGYVGEEVGLGGDMFTAIVRWVMTVCSVIISLIIPHTMPSSSVGGFI
jgi:hypothetical protein